MTAYEKAYEAALRLLDFKDRTEKELREKLLKKEHPSDIVDQVIDSMKESGLIDDLRYAELYTESRLQAGKGKNWIRTKLREKGIASSVMDSVFSEIFENQDEELLCLTKALSLCGLSDTYEIGADKELYPCLTMPEFSAGPESRDNCDRSGGFSEDINEEVRYFYRKVPECQTDRRLIAKEHEKAKASLVRRLVSAGFSSGAAFSAARKIDKL